MASITSSSPRLKNQITLGRRVRSFHLWSSKCNFLWHLLFFSSKQNNEGVWKMFLMISPLGGGHVGSTYHRTKTKDENNHSLSS